MIGDIDLAQYLETFFQFIAGIIQLLSVIDYFFIGALLFFVIRGFIVGAAKIVIHGLWLIGALLLATLLYEPLTNLLSLSSFIANPTVSHFAGFAIIIILVYAIKYFIYKTLEKIAVLHGPCPFNRFLAMLIGYVVIVSLSWYIALDVHTGALLVNLLVNDIIRFAVSFVLVLAVLVTISYVLMTLLNVKVGIDRPCPLIKALQPLDDILNAKSIDSFSNSAGGAVIGILQACIVTIILFMVLDSLGVVTDATYTTGIARELKSISHNVYDVLAHQLTFLQKVV